MQIDVYADIACPWCYIGMKRIQAAAALKPELTIERTWKPFQLQPQLPAEGVPWAEFAEKKFGGMARAKSLFKHVVDAGASDGIVFNFDQVKKANNTQDAHRLVLWAQSKGKAWSMAEALFKAYFTDGKDLNDLEDLVSAAVEAGFDAEDVRALLASGSYRDDVREAQETANNIGVSGVPFYVLDNKYGVSGAQPVEVFVRAIETAAGEV